MPVFLVDTSQARLDWAVRRGIVSEVEAILNAPHLPEMILERTGDHPVDAAALCTPRSATRSVLRQAIRYVRADGCIGLSAGTDSRDALPELPGVDLDGIRRANTCGLGSEVVHVTTADGKKLWLTGHSGASERFLNEAMRLFRNDARTYARVISHVAAFDAAPQMFASLLDPAAPLLVGEPGTKVIIDMTATGQTVAAFDLSEL